MIFAGAFASSDAIKDGVYKLGLDLTDNVRRRLSSDGGIIDQPHRDHARL